MGIKEYYDENVSWIFSKWGILLFLMFFGLGFVLDGGIQFGMKDYREDLSNYTGKVGYTFPERKEFISTVDGSILYINFPKGVKNEVLFKGKYKNGLKEGKWEVFPVEKQVGGILITFGWSITLTFKQGKPIGNFEKYDMEGNPYQTIDCSQTDCSYYFSKEHLDTMVDEIILDAARGNYFIN